MADPFQANVCTMQLVGPRALAKEQEKSSLALEVDVDSIIYICLYIQIFIHTCMHIVICKYIIHIYIYRCMYICMDPTLGSHPESPDTSGPGFTPPPGDAVRQQAI